MLPLPRAPAGRCSFYPGAEVVHVGGASHGGRMFRENVRGHLRFLAEAPRARAGGAGAAAAARSLRLRGALFRGERGGAYREAARWLALRPTCRTLLER